MSRRTPLSIVCTLWIYLSLSAFARAETPTPPSPASTIPKVETIAADAFVDPLLAVAKFIANTVGSQFYGRECQTEAQLETTDCAILGFLAGAVVGTQLYQTKVLNRLNQIISTLDDLQLHINKI